ncbi:MAG: diadenosine tetraphosphatase [Alteromonas sp. Nap_26]|nr:MAG: diadenosine tetraphosphatase [Alteromonas sp. Nap_26]
MLHGKTFVIGDIQGCYKGLRRLLDKAHFDPSTDMLYAVGDLVARGEDSLSTLRFLRDLNASFSTVLGNHDLHLLAVANGIRKAKKSDKLTSLLNAADLPDLLNWLRQFPLASKIDSNTLIVHAGLYPKWSIDECISLSNEVSQALKGDSYVNFLAGMYGNNPDSWSPDLPMQDRLRFVVNACTRMRFVQQSGKLDFDNKSHPDSVPANQRKKLAPWFERTNEQLRTTERVIFGHWAALLGETRNPQFIGLDTGYVWGQSMSLLCIDSKEVIRIDAKDG